ncbi:MAG: 16S rRNA (cytidine(1402)-2'-O)-methyltransferase [Vicinamibacterales bacterium]|nr:16S rRNA (cytidine(1402)-2'-O)-methyltransferase [Vicinamibacterales bacterium]
MPDSRTGTLFLVATPIGNLEDITFRALRVLRECDLVAAEDTRHTARLLNHYDVRTPTTSVHEHNEPARIAGLVAKLTAGSRIALVSDAGTPGVSDPGFKLVRAAIAAGVRVEAIPGPSAVLTALSASGLPTDSFVFVGFPPARKAARETWFRALKDQRRTLVFFEAPHRIRESLEAARLVLGDRDISVCRELTKIHEELVRGPISAVLGRLGEERGEFTVVMSGDPPPSAGPDPAQTSDEAVFAAFSAAVDGGLDRREALKSVADALGLRSRDVYAAIERARRS